MAVYAAYHRNRWNRLTHFIGVPAIIFAILIPMSWVSLGEDLSLAHLFLGAVLAYYFLLDVPLALATAVAVGALFLAAKLAAGTGITSGWICQLVGHVFEGRRPALADNLFQIFIAPIFLVAEAFFALGLKRELLKKIETKLASSTYD